MSACRPATPRTFLRLAGSPGVEDDGPLPDDVVASGAHAPAPERICEALAAELGAPHVVGPGAGHFVAAAPGFADRLEQFLGQGATGGSGSRRW